MATTILQRYKEERNGVQPKDSGNLVKYDDVMKLLREMSNLLDNIDVLNELEENDLSPCLIVDQFINANV